MKNLVILGAGTAGTMVANRMRHRLPADWTLTVVDPSPTHLYQPGLLFLPFGAQDEDKIQRPRRKTLRSGVDWVEQSVARVEPDHKQVVLEGGDKLPYDLLVVATGTVTNPEETEGMVGDHWHRSIFDFYTLEGALKLRDALDRFEEGRLLVNVVDMPIKCPVAPLEFLFLADAFFTDKGIRDRVELVYATPLEGAFTKPVCTEVLQHMLVDRGITLECEFNAGEVDGDAKVLKSFDEREVPYDLLVTIPLHSGAPLIEESGLGDAMGFVPTDKHTLRAKGWDDIFVIGDATDLPSSKAGSVAHFESEILEENLLRTIRGQSLEEGFDGHANCFIESGHGRALLIDFNYEVEPLPGRFPVPWIGPFALLKETRINHLGKLGFRSLYWNALLPGRPVPISPQMSMAGKRSPDRLLPANT